MNKLYEKDGKLYKPVSFTHVSCGVKCDYKDAVGRCGICPLPASQTFQYYGEVKSEGNRAEVVIAALQRELTQVTKEKVDAQEVIKSLEKSLENSVKENIEFRKQIDYLTESNRDLEGTANALDDMVAELQEMVEEVHKLNDEFASENERLSKLVQTFKGACESTIKSSQVFIGMIDN